MNPEELIAKANNNDAEAMIELTGYYVDRQDWTKRLIAQIRLRMPEILTACTAAALHNLRMSAEIWSSIPGPDVEVTHG